MSKIKKTTESKNSLDGTKKKIQTSLHLNSPVTGCTHTFYKYPARFHPDFAKTVISQFTEKGDIVIDPFLGGGTTAVESICSGRRFFGVDINPIASFLSSVKTTPLTDKEIDQITIWADNLSNRVNLHKKHRLSDFWSPYTKYLPWWIRKTIGFLIHNIDRCFWVDRQKNFLKCNLLSTAQWALDSKTKAKTKDEFIKHFKENLYLMIEGMFDLKMRIKKNLDVPPSEIQRRRKILTRPILGIEKDLRVIKNWIPAKLILTSPPYPGVHVLYHRWQVNGRKETPAPYWIINTPDGNGLSYYTLGNRLQKGLINYFKNLKFSFNSIKNLMNKDTLLVQLVGFSDPEWQLEKYLKIMKEVGLNEISLSRCRAQRIQRKVPNRKWYTQYKVLNSYSDQEFLIVHKLNS